MKQTPIVSKGTALTIRGQKLTVTRIANDGVELQAQDGNIKFIGFETAERAVSGDPIDA